MRKAATTQADVMKAALGYQDGLLSYAYGMMRDWALAEDVVQNAYLVVMEKWHEFQPGTSVFGWSKAIVRFKALEMLRARRRERPEDDLLLVELVERSMDEYLGDEAAERQRETMHKLQECLQKITERSLELVLERYARRRSYEQLATLFNMNIEAVRKSLYRIRRTLQNCVEGLADWELAAE